MNFEYKQVDGFDVSFYQDNNNTPQGINFVKMKTWGAEFVIIRAGQLVWADPDFTVNWANAKAAGFPRSAYWFGDKNGTPQSQAKLFWELVRNDPAEGMYFIDYEYRSWTDWRLLKEFIVEFQRISGLPNERIGIYTGYYYWLAHSPATSTDRNWFGKYSLWLAWYTDDPAIVLVPDPWKNQVGQPLLWQKGTPSIGYEVGVESIEVDYNWFNGSIERFNRLLGGNLVTPPPITGDKMHIYRTKATATPYSNLRETPNGVDVGDVYPNTEFQVDRIDLDTLGREWVHSVTVGMVGYILKSLCDYIGEATPTPPETGEYILHVKDGVTRKFILGS